MKIMKKREDLIKTQEFWMEKVQNHLYANLQAYMEKYNLNKPQIADQLGVKSSYISRILNGNFDDKLSKLVELSLAIDKAPVINLEDLDVYIQKDKLGIQYLSHCYINFFWNGDSKIVISLPTNKSFDPFEVKETLKALLNLKSDILVQEENEFA